MAPSHMCWYLDSTLSCRYYISYAGGSETRGIVSMETLTLLEDKKIKSLNNVVFGCANDSQDESGVPGIIEVGNHSSSLLGQIAVSHFSYFLFQSNKYFWRGTLWSRSLTLRLWGQHTFPSK